MRPGHVVLGVARSVILVACGGVRRALPNEVPMKPLRVLATSIYLALFASGAAGACTVSPKTRNELGTATGGAGGSGGSTSLSSSSGAGAPRSGGNGGATTTGGDDLFDASPGGDAAGGGRVCAQETQFVYALAA